MVRSSDAFSTDDPLLIELGNIYRLHAVSVVHDPLNNPALLQDIQNAVAHYLPQSPVRKVVPVIGYEQSPEQKRENVRRAIESVSPMVEIWADVSALDLECQRSETHYESTDDPIDYAE